MRNCTVVTFILSVVICATHCKVVFPKDHILGGTYKNIQFRAFGWRHWEGNREFEFHFLDSLGGSDEYNYLCWGFPEGLRDKFKGKVLGFATIEEPSTRQPWRNLTKNAGCAYERMIASSFDIGAAGILELLPLDGNASQLHSFDNLLALQREWWSNFNRSIFSGELIDMPCVSAQLGEALLPYIAVFGFYQVNGFIPSDINYTGIPDTVITISCDKGAFDGAASTYGIFLQVVYSIWSLLLLVHAIVFIVCQLYVYKKVNAYSGGMGFPRLAIIVLSLEGLANLLRFLYLCVDPFWNMNGQWGWPSWWAMFNIQGWISLTLMATITISVFWLHIVFRPSKEPNILSSPCEVVVLMIAWILILAVEFVPSILRVTLVPVSSLSVTIRATGIACSIIALAVASFFLYTGITLLTKMLPMRRQAARLAQQQKHMLKIVVVIGLLLILLVPFYLLVTRLSFFRTVFGWFFVWTWVWGILLAISTFQIVTFKIYPWQARQEIAEGTGSTSSSGTSRGRIKFRMGTIEKLNLERRKKSSMMVEDCSAAEMEEQFTEFAVPL